MAAPVAAANSSEHGAVYRPCCREHIIEYRIGLLRTAMRALIEVGASRDYRRSICALRLEFGRMSIASRINCLPKLVRSMLCDYIAETDLQGLCAKATHVATQLNMVMTSQAFVDGGCANQDGVGVSVLQERYYLEIEYEFNVLAFEHRSELRRMSASLELYADMVAGLGLRSRACLACTLLKTSRACLRLITSVRGAICIDDPYDPMGRDTFWYLVREERISQRDLDSLSHQLANMRQRPVVNGISNIKDLQILIRHMPTRFTDSWSDGAIDALRGVPRKARVPLNENDSRFEAYIDDVNQYSLLLIKWLRTCRQVVMACCA